MKRGLRRSDDLDDDHHHTKLEEKRIGGILSCARKLRIARAKKHFFGPEKQELFKKIFGPI